MQSFNKNGKLQLNIWKKHQVKQEEALNLLKMGKNAFLTGAAGSGKTYLLNQYIRYLKENNVSVAVTASTGIAATHLHGMTIHAWSGIGIKNELTEKDLENIAKNKRVRSNYRRTKVLIIDEISMLHRFQFEMIDKIARYFLQAEKPFGGIQIVLCGDFFQLPPVSSEPSEKKHFAFESPIWGQSDFCVCYLQEQHRQKDDPLLTVLNDIRQGSAGEHTKVPLRTRYKKEPHNGAHATKLYSHNVNVDVINDQELANLSGEEKVFAMKTHGFSALVEGLKKSCLAPDVLKLKKNAEVMFVKNDISGRYVNGTRGVVIDFEKKQGLPIVKTTDNITILVELEEWTYQEDDFVLAKLTQLPLRLAWAITIHKSQGMTLDAAEIDLGKAFEPGMGYVALSRVRSLNGLKLMNLNEMALRVHPDVLEKDDSFRQNSADNVKYLKNLLVDEKEKMYQSVLSKKEKVTRSASVKTEKKQESSTHEITLSLLKENLSLEEIAEKRELTFSTIISHIQKLKSLNLLDETLLQIIKKGIPTENFAQILAAIKKSPDGKLKPIYEAFEGKYSYNTLHLVRLFFEDNSLA